MEHRRFLPHPEAHRPFAGSGLFARAGGSAAIDALIDGLYDRIETDAALRRLFGRDLANERAAQKAFFVEWLGGDDRYTDRAHVPLAHRHDLLPITRALAARWLAHFLASLDVAVPDDGARRAIYEKARVLAMALVVERDGSAPSELRAHPHGTCLRYEPAVASIPLARKGDAAALRTLVRRAPDVLASPVHAARLVHVAALAGHAAVVELLLERGVDPNKPSPIEPLIFVTPLCAARVKRRRDVEALLVRRGAEEDVFTHAFVGAVARLAQAPAAAQATDPAVDALAITPIHHAIAGGSVDAVRALLAHVALANEPLVGGARALRQAAHGENVAMVRMLLERGASARAIGAGRWVLHPELAPLLSDAGASVDRTGSWIGLSCTGNQARRDDPDFVAALLRHGARATDRRLVGQGADGGKATALHYAAKAGFVRTIAVLLAHGADASATDDNGATPLDWLARAAKTVDRAAVRRSLQR